MKTRLKRGELERTVLNTVSVAGVLALAALAPNAARLLKYLPSNNSKFRYNARSTANRLIDKGLLERISKDGNFFLQLTEQGSLQLQVEEEQMKLSSVRPKKWDGKWHMVMFDIPEQRKNTRNKLRTFMISAGFTKFQDSAWIYPYRCDDFITLLKAELRIGKDLQYVIVSQIQNDLSLRKHFNL